MRAPAFSSPRHRSHGRNRLVLALWALLPALGAGGCLYDQNDRCGPQQEVSGTEACVCEAGLVLVGTSCEPCPEHELEVSGACLCEEGFERPVEGQACAAVIVGGLGASCSASQPCTDETFDSCQSSGVLGPYCTKHGCASDEDCDVGYACQLDDGDSFCERAPVGQGDACSSSADCTSGDATFCESFVSQRCLVADCSLQHNDCFAGWECCDLSSVGVPGLPKSLCAPVGQCP